MKGKDPIADLMAEYQAMSKESVKGQKIFNVAAYHNSYIQHRMACEILSLKDQIKQLKNNLKAVL